MAGETDDGNTNVVEHPKQHQLRLATTNEGKARSEEALKNNDATAWTVEDLLRFSLQRHLENNDIGANGAVVIMVNTQTAKLFVARSNLSDLELWGTLSRLTAVM